MPPPASGLILVDSGFQTLPGLPLAVSVGLRAFMAVGAGLPPDAVLVELRSAEESVPRDGRDSAEILRRHAVRLYPCPSGHIAS